MAAAAASVATTAVAPTVTVPVKDIFAPDAVPTNGNGGTAATTERKKRGAPKGGTRTPSNYIVCVPTDEHLVDGGTGEVTRTYAVRTGLSLLDAKRLLETLKDPKAAVVYKGRAVTPAYSMQVSLSEV